MDSKKGILRDLAMYGMYMIFQLIKWNRQTPPFPPLWWTFSHQFLFDGFPKVLHPPINPPSSILHSPSSILHPPSYPPSSIFQPLSAKYNPQSSILSHTCFHLIPRTLRKSWYTHGTERSSSQWVVELGFIGGSNVILINNFKNKNIFGKSRHITVWEIKFRRRWCFSFFICFCF